MPQSLVQLNTHIVFSTKNRHPFLTDPDLRRRTHGFLSAICTDLDSPSVRTGGVDDHVHLLCRLSKTKSVSEVVRELKRKSSKWVKTQGSEMESFYWQEGYGAFSVSPSHLQKLTSYIENQVEHHRKEAFQDEFRRLLKKYDVEYDEQYLWD